MAINTTAAQNTTNHKLSAVFWDMDGTLIDSEPYWHDAEIQIAKEHGGEWNEELAWQYSGGSLKDVAEAMIARGTKMGVEEIGNAMVDYVAQKEQIEVPWVPDVLNLLQKLADAGIPSILVSNSPRRLVENIVNHAPKGAFAGYICGDDGYATKPSSEPYLAAGKLLGISAQNIKYCIAIEDSFAGLKSAAASGATTLAQTAYSNLDVSNGPQFADIHGYEDVTPQTLERYIIARIDDFELHNAREVTSIR
ncbi:HAD family hydrolase [Gardnerella vaginalis]|uniref:HAD family hydrolase n=1 Tax=Gardnerella vaginalis TaxID=2702 RepID=UPI001FF55460|nr:HAD family hydrolase [Gardnerella vaginalis]